MFGFLKNRRRAELRAQPLGETEHAVVARAVHLWRHLSAEERTKLAGDVRVFLGEKTFEGAGGLEVTDEMRLTIAAQACMLALHRDTDLFPDLETIVLYPSAFVANVRKREGAVVIEGPEARLGESWSLGLVILAWDEVARDVRSFHTGHNVVLHELAHQLDAEDGAVDGAPDLGSKERYVAWAHVFGEEYQALGERLHAGLRTDLAPYAATSPAEFFAVVTEAFFERGDVLAVRHPDLYAELVSFYRIDPAALAAKR
jgi:MtfA peptidase